jgi:hypothetical protein
VSGAWQPVEAEDAPAPPMARPQPRAALRIVLGLFLLLAGCVMALPLVPGPGIPLLILGLALLSDHFPWAKRLHDKFRHAAWRLRSFVSSTIRGKRAGRI